MYVILSKKIHISRHSKPFTYLSILIVCSTISYQGNKEIFLKEMEKHQFGREKGSRTFGG